MKIKTLSSGPKIRKFIELRSGDVFCGVGFDTEAFFKEPFLVLNTQFCPVGINIVSLTSGRLGYALPGSSVVLLDATLSVKEETI